jgi:alpha-glucosidase (family GH31 glycosyl hydrolase)
MTDKPLIHVAAALTFCACSDDAPSMPSETCKFAEAIDATAAPPIHTPRWAFEPWISKDISDRDDTYAFVAGFLERDIPLGVVVLDSPWETNYNTFVPNPSRYPAFDEMVADLRADDIRLVLWITQMVNVQSFDFELGGDSYSGEADNYAEGLDCGFYTDDAATWGWWKGVGSAIDFFNPEAAGWWHRQQDALFDMGVAGFKLDFGESYIRADTVQTAAGPVPHQDYSEAYYRDFFAYGAAKVGLDEFVTMVRPYDESYDFEGRFFARPEHAPVGWVGDNRRDFVGLEDALDHIFRSADAGYVVIGSDLGGYLNVDDVSITTKVPFDPVVFQRWTALSALTPFMQLHGRGNLAPWTVPSGDVDETVAIYRYWAKLHHQLVPFFYSLAEEAYAEGDTIIRPLGDPASWPGDYRYLLGDALLVAPILDASGVRDVALPAGEWHDWWNPDSDAIAGGTTLTAHDVGDALRIPLFVKRGAIIPLADADAVTGLGTSSSAGALTVLAYPDAQSTFTLHEEDGETTSISAVATSLALTVSLSRRTQTTWLSVRSDSMPTAVSAGAALGEQATRAALDAAADGWFYDAATRSTWVKLPAGGPAEVILSL